MTLYRSRLDVRTSNGSEGAQHHIWSSVCRTGPRSRSQRRLPRPRPSTCQRDVTVPSAVGARGPQHTATLHRWSPADAVDRGIHLRSRVYGELDSSTCHSFHGLFSILDDIYIPPLSASPWIFRNDLS